MADLAPIALSTYSRINHLKKTVESLKRNSLASQSDLFVFSDGAREGDNENVNLVRKYIRGIDGFRSVTIIERPSNSRVYNNREGIKRLAEAYGKYIFLEEDVVTAPDFLEYMNHCLAIYQKESAVLSITGYLPPIRIPAEYSFENFFLPRFNAWGFGSWVDRFDPFELNFSLYELIELRKNRRSFVDRYVGQDFWGMAFSDCTNRFDALDVKLTFRQARTGQLTSYPRKSYSLNIGNDGSGIHCKTTSRFDIDLSSQFSASDCLLEPGIDDRLAREFSRFRKANWLSRQKDSIALLFPRLAAR